MYSIKKNVLLTVALLKEYNIKHIVLSPGSRNAPLIQSFTQDQHFTCHIIVDERNAAFYALGIIQRLQQPVAICCTSGTALLNYAPGVAEAYYQQLPLVVLSADRSNEWIGQMDGQTIVQTNALQTVVKRSVQLPEIQNDTDEWFCNRLLNQALIDCTATNYGPVHINIPISEPLFDYSATELPAVRKIQFRQGLKVVDANDYADTWNSSHKKMIVVGQLPPSDETRHILEKLTTEHNCVILTEHLANCNSKYFISNFDVMLYAIDEEHKKDFAPDLLITLGGHVVSKRLKQFLRQYKPKHHWHLSQTEEVVDLYQSLTDLINTDEIPFLEQLSKITKNGNDANYSELWMKTSERTESPSADIPFSDISVIRNFINTIPHNSALQLANSSTVRNVQLYTIDPSIKIYCNRGTNGIDSSLPTAVGFAAVHDKPVYLIIGDLSFFYGLNALWNIKYIKNLRILLINNSGGGIFHLLPGLNKSASLDEYVSAGHNTNAKEWSEAAGMNYLLATNDNELEKHLQILTNETNCEQSILLEVKTDIEISKKIFQTYYHHEKDKLKQ